MAVFAKDLRDAVLQAAFQGKLTKQLDTDSSVDELLKSIEDEKEKLIKEKKIKKEKKLPIINDEEIPFDIPNNWKWIRLQNISTKVIDGDHNPPHGSSVKTDYLMVSAQNINNNTLVNLEQVRYLSKDIFEIEDKRTMLKKGDILLTIVGTLGRSCVYNFDYNICFQRSVAIISTEINNYYLKYIFDSPYIQSFMVNNATGTAQKGFYLSKVKSLVIPIPPIEEQQRIVDKIEELMAKIDKYEKIENQLEELKKQFPIDMKDALLQAAMQGKLTEQSSRDSSIKIKYINKQKNKNIEELMYEIPNNWSYGTIESFCNVISSKQYQIKDKDVKEIGEIPVISQSQKYIIGYSNEYSKILKIDTPVIIFGDHTTIVKYIDFDFIIAGDGVKIFKPNKLVNARYLFYAFQFITINLSQKGGYSRHYKFIKNVPIPIPPIEEQQRIVEKLENLLPICESLLELI